MGSSQADDLGGGQEFLCREPWESYYILRRGIMPCCYGATAIAPMSEWQTAWNSPVLQEIRAHLAKGTFSSYCLNSPTCPIVQRHTRRNVAVAKRPPGAVTPAVLRVINHLLGGLPARIYRKLRPGS
jgi:hypothetical protein